MTLLATLLLAPGFFCITPDTAFCDLNPAALAPSSAVPSAALAPLALPPSVLPPAASASVLASAPLPQKRADGIVAPGLKAPGGKVLEWTSAEEKPYWYRLPETIHEEQPPALILMLHGTGSKWGWAFWNYPIAAGKFRPQDIVVAPEGMTPGHSDTFNFQQGKKDGEHIASIIRTFQKEYPISRVYLYGHSQGAFFCYWFAGEHPDLVDGIVAHAGNVLSVRHSKLTKQKVAIGILHGREDAVVPVDCAFRTRQIYADQEYSKIKLYVVEGLTEKSGHWPLPIQVGEMFAWLDQVTVFTPKQALNVVAVQLTSANPDLALIKGSLARAEALLNGYNADDSADLQAKLSQGLDFLSQVRAAHQEALLATAGAVKSKTPFGDWASHFVVANRFFAGDPEWDKAMKKARKLAVKHHKMVEKALLGLDVANSKAFVAGLDAMEKGFLSARYRELELRMSRQADHPPKGVKAKDMLRLGDLMSQRTSDLELGETTAREITAEVALKLQASK